MMPNLTVIAMRKRSKKMDKKNGDGKIAIGQRKKLYPSIKIKKNNQQKNTKGIKISNGIKRYKEIFKLPKNRSQRNHLKIQKMEKAKI